MKWAVTACALFAALFLGCAARQPLMLGEFEQGPALADERAPGAAPQAVSEFEGAREVSEQRREEDAVLYVRERTLVEERVVAHIEQQAVQVPEAIEQREEFEIGLDILITLPPKVAYPEGKENTKTVTSADNTNTTDIAQPGNNNILTLSQPGSLNFTSVLQEGNENQFRAEQAGVGGSIVIAQPGNNNVLALSQTGSQNHVQALQGGNENEFRAEQAGIGGSIVVQQFGDRNHSNIIQR